MEAFLEGVGTFFIVSVAPCCSWRSAIWQDVQNDLFQSWLASISVLAYCGGRLITSDGMEASE